MRTYVMGRHWYVTTTISCPVVGWLQVSCQTLLIITPLLFSNGGCVCVHIHTIGVSLIYIYLSMDRSIYIHQNRIYIYVYIYSVLVPMVCRCGAPTSHIGTSGNYDAGDGPRWTMHRRKIEFFPPPPFQYRYDSAKYRTAWSPSCCYIHTLVILVHPLSHIIYIYTFIYQSRCRGHTSHTCISLTYHPIIFHLRRTYR